MLHLGEKRNTATMTTCTEAKGLVAFPSRAAWK